MLAYVARLTVVSALQMLAITLLAFLVIHLAPGEPVVLQQELQTTQSPQQRQTLRELYGLDKPLHVQYGVWLNRLVRLDLGRSFSPDGRPVWEKIRERIPVTLSLNLAEICLIYLTAVPLGVFAAVRRHSLFDRLATVFVFIGFATPDFWLALLLMILFGVQLGWLPISGLRSLNWEYLAPAAQAWDLVTHLVLPIFIGAFGGLAGLSRFMRGSMLEVIRQDYIRTAQAKGLPERVVFYKHALRNAVLPIVTILGLSLPGLIGGSVIVESVFAIPGMGQLAVQSVFARDYPVVMGLLTIGAGLTLVGNRLADVCYGIVDPRIRIAGRSA
ncbi:MAG TPA: ABC transporter permease [Candidatus Methylomirabilis sp.]|jgi:peptide/nickel transport system permease protein|nr:ABC transporter permease [Candidatus Methylomirabilis sp.]